MAKRPSVTNITSGYASTTAINANVNSLAEGFDNTLSLDGSTPNAMGADLDLNSNDLLNGGSASFTSLTVGGSNVLEPTAARVKELYESNSDTNAFTDADHSKLDGVADSANNYSHPNHTGDVTSSGDGATTIANNAVTGAKIADDAVDSEHIADGAIDLAHMSANSVDSDQYVDGSIDTAHIGDDQVTYAKIQNVSSNNVLLGNDDGAGSAVQELTAANVRTIINVEDGATADQTAAEIRTLVESASDSNVFTDADHTKLNGIEASADVTDATNVTAAGALMDSEVTNLAQVKAFDSSDYATAAQGSTADAAMPKAGGTFTGDISFEGATDNDYETTITVTDPTADRTITLPNASGTVLLSDGDGSNLTGVQAASVDIDESTDDDVNYNILFSDTSGSGSIQMTPQQDDDGFTFNPSSNLVATTGTFRAGPGVADSDFLFLGYGANSSTEYVAMGVQTGYASITAGGVGSTSTDLRIRTANSGTEADKVTIKADGKTGIGTTSPSEALDVVGNIAVSGTVDGVDIAARDAVLTSTTTTANAAMPLSGGTFTGDVTILNTDGGSGRAPDFNLKRDSASPAAWDYLGAVRFLGEDGGSNETPYASILGRIVDPTSGSEDGRLEIWQQKAGTGTLTYVFEHDKFKLMNEQPIMWQDHHGTAYDVFVEPATPTADRTITLPDATGTVMVQDSSGYVTGGSSSANMILQGSNPNFRLIDTDADASNFEIYNDYQGDDTYIVSVDNNDEKTNSSLLIKVDNEDVASFNTTGADVTGRLQVSNGSTSSGYIDLLEDSDNGTNKIKLEAPQTISSDKTITLPDHTGTVGLHTDLVTGDLLQTTDISVTGNVASVTWGSSFITDDYDIYDLVMTGVKVDRAATSLENPKIEFTHNGGTVISSANYSKYILWYGQKKADSYESTGLSSSSASSLSLGLQNASNSYNTEGILHAHLRFYNLRETDNSIPASMFVMSGHFTTSPTDTGMDTKTYHAQGYIRSGQLNRDWTSDVAIDGIKLSTVYGSNYRAGVMKLYGMGKK